MTPPVRTVAGKPMPQAARLLRDRPARRPADHRRPGRLGRHRADSHDLEIVMGEGPVHALPGDDTPIRVTGPALADRWPRYGPAVTELGVQAVLAVPPLPTG